EVSEQLLVERAPVRADAHRLAVLDCGLDNGAELTVLLFLEADIAGIDTIFIERLGARRMLGQEFVTDVMKVTDDGHFHAALEQPPLDRRNRGRRLVAVTRDAHDFGARARKLLDLPRGCLHVRGVGIGYGLNDDGRPAAHPHTADVDSDRPASFLWPGFAHFGAPESRMTLS